MMNQEVLVRDIEEKMKLVLHIVLLLISKLWKIIQLQLEIEIQWNKLDFQLVNLRNLLKKRLDFNI